MRTDRFIPGVWIVDLVVSRDGIVIDEDSIVVPSVDLIDQYLDEYQAKKPRVKIAVAGVKIVRKTRRQR